MSLPAGGFRSIIFDCDSTLSAIEGIDELAGPHRAEVQALTDAAMAGEVPLEEVYGRRLEIIRPTRERIEALGRAYIDAAVPDAVDTVNALCWLGKEVRILSGGLRPPVEAFARTLGLRTGMVAAVEIHFDDDGEYAGFDDRSPLARSGGKAEQIRRWDLPRPVLLVGDGATDAEARPAVDAFVAYMGVALRPAVAEAADVVLHDPSLAPVLALAAGQRERKRLLRPPWAALLARGLALLERQGDRVTR
jgi:phosphoserine phosphatase